MKQAIYKSREFLRPSQVATKRRRKKIFRLISIIVLLIFILGCFIFMMRADFLKIQEASVNGNVSIKTDDLKLSLKNIVEGNYFFVLPKDNILIFPRAKIINELMNQFPRIDTLSISIEKNILVVNIVERKPHALWCGVSIDQSIDPCYFIDPKGFVFSEAPQFDGSSYLKIYGANAPAEEDFFEMINSSSSWQFVPEYEYLNIQTFINEVKNLGLELPVFELSDADTYKFQIKNNGILLASRDMKLTDTMENLKAGLSNDIFWDKTKKLVKVEYIDMRYGNKIFYKLIE